MFFARFYRGSKLDVLGLDHPAVELEKLLINYLPIIPDNSPAQVSGDLYTCRWILKPNFRKKRPEEQLSINLLEWSVDDAKRHPILKRTVDQCLVEMVHLPDIFLEHPVVKVVESDNEMVISDLYTNEFIAKKIFYDQPAD